MSKHITHTVQVEFGDCDPARIVWFPNFFRWIDAASRNFFVQCGVPPWHLLTASHGIVGTPLVDTKARFVNTASYGDTLAIDVNVTEWRGKSFLQHHQITRGGDLIMECDEVRIFGAPREDGSPGIRAIAIPPDIRALCS